MAQNYGIKAIHHSQDAHDFGQGTPVTGRGPVFRVYNDATGTDMLFRILEDGSVRVVDGAVGTPAIGPDSDDDTGLYFPSAAEIAAAVAGTLKLHLQASKLISKVVMELPNGSAATPALSFESMADAGLYRYGADELGLAVAGALVARLSGGALRLVGAQGVSERHDNSNSPDLDWDDGNAIRVLLDGNKTLTVTGGIAGGEYALELEQDATGGRTVTWPASFRGKDGGSIPQPDGTANRTTIYALYFNGSSYAVGEFGSFDL